MQPYFVIYGLHGRVGSCWLAELLRPACLLEPQEIWQPYQRSRSRRLGVTADPYEDPAQYLRQFCRARGVRGARAFPHYPPDPSDKRLVRGVDKAVFLYRRNVTEQMVSFEVARHCGWRAKTQRNPTSKIRMNVPRMVERFETARKRWRSAVLAVPPERRLVLAYRHIPKRAEEAREFLSIPGPVPEPLEARKQRSPERYREIVVNLDEVNKEMGEEYGTVFGEFGSVDPAEGLVG